MLAMAPAARATTTLSAMSSRMTCQRLAPSERRTASSR
jgi:hypothetical protein